MALMLLVTLSALLVLGLYRNPLATLDAINTLGASGENASSIFDVVSYALQSVLALVLAGLATSLGYMGYQNISRVRDSYTGAPADD
jgi:hypothetical protein